MHVPFIVANDDALAVGLCPRRPLRANGAAVGGVICAQHEAKRSCRVNLRIYVAMHG